MTHVDNVASLLAVDAMQYPDVRTRGFYAPSDGGGDWYSWSTTVSKSQHNGITITDPTMATAPGAPTLIRRTTSQQRLIKMLSLLR